jgi:OOP family OmpA-OmpF porin
MLRNKESFSMNHHMWNPRRAAQTGRCIALAAAMVAASVGTAQAEGLYFGGQVGAPDYHSTINGVSGGGSGVGLKLYGGYQFTPNFAVEGGAFGLGHVDNAIGKVQTRGLYVDAVGRYPLGTNWSVLGSAGLAAARFDSSPGENDDSPGVKLGAGVQYDISKEVAVRAQYDRYHFTGAYDGKANIGQTTVGLRYAF